MYSSGNFSRYFTSNLFVLKEMEYLHFLVIPYQVVAGSLSIFRGKLDVRDETYFNEMNRLQMQVLIKAMPLQMEIN